MMPALPLYGHEAAEAAFLASRRQGRLHHAWLIEGPSGIGKARFAERIAAFLLGARGPETAPLDAPADDPVMRTILSGSHPDLKVLRRELNDRGKLAQDISVDQVRGLTHFFSMKPGMGGWRICILDAIDEANRAASNALLKTLEEPPPQSLLLLVNHRSKPLLPTIRSRCRSLQLFPLGEEDCRKALELTDAAPAATKLARGRPGLGIQMSSSAAISAADAARALIKAMPRPADRIVITALNAAAATPEAEQAFRMEILDWVAWKAESDPHTAKTWLSLSRLAAEGEALNMDAAQLASKLIAALQEAATS